MDNRRRQPCGDTATFFVRMDSVQLYCYVRSGKRKRVGASEADVLSDADGVFRGVVRFEKRGRLQKERLRGVVPFGGYGGGADDCGGILSAALGLRHRNRRDVGGHCLDGGRNRDRADNSLARL